MIERIPRRQHAYGAAAKFEHLSQGGIERGSPRACRPTNQGRRQREMARPAEHDHRRLDEVPSRPAQAFDTILADSDDGQPSW